MAILYEPFYAYWTDEIVLEKDHLKPSELKALINEMIRRKEIVFKNGGVIR